MLKIAGAQFRVRRGFANRSRGFPYVLPAALHFSSLLVYFQLMMRFARLMVLGTAFLSVQMVLLNGEPECNRAAHDAAQAHQMTGMDMSKQPGGCDHAPVGRSCEQMGACLLVFTLTSTTDLARSVPLSTMETERIPKLTSVLVAPELPPPRA